MNWLNIISSRRIGFRPSLGTMDSATARLPKDGPIIIVTASFEGGAIYFSVM